MAITFAHSPRPTIGVEIEFQLIDPVTLDVTPRSIELLELCEARGIERVKAEIAQSMIEIDTEISDDIKECRGHLERRIAQLRGAAKQLGVELCTSGTHPYQRWTNDKIYPSNRYEYLVRKFQWLARRLTVYSVHVHIGIESGEQAVAISNQVIPYLPHLLALSASSPYWEGVDTGMHSCRAGVMASFPISGVPYYFPNWAGFENYCETLLNVGAIASLKDLYWFIRPSPSYGTLEFRICDGISTLSETMAVVALIQALVVWIDEGLKDGTRKREVSMRNYWIAPENIWIAARDGLEGAIILDDHGNRRQIADDVLQLIETLRPVAQRLNSEEELLYLKEIIRRGTSATRQRVVYCQTGSLPAVVNALIRELETDQAIC